MTKLVLASNNAGKLKEFRAILEPLGMDLHPQAEFNVADADETGLSFIENAIIKARHASEHTGLPALADDSGLCVNALGGAPGIYSARFAGEHGNHQANIDLLLNKLSSTGNAQRQAHFICTLALVRHAKDPDPMIAIGKWHGNIANSRQGDGGFGYDPIFIVPTHNCTAAELDNTIKNTISHRAIAIQALLNDPALQELNVCTTS